MTTKKSIFTMYEYVFTLVVVIIIGFITDIGSSSFEMEVATLLLCGVGMPLYFIYQIGLQTRLLRKGEAAVATITDCFKDGKYSDASYYSCFEFTAQRKIYNIQSKQGYSSRPDYKTGEQIKIHYNPDNPQQAEIDDVLRELLDWLFVIRIILFIMVAGICVVAAVAMVQGSDFL